MPPRLPWRAVNQELWLSLARFIIRKCMAIAINLRTPRCVGTVAGCVSGPIKPPDERRILIRQYAKFVKQLRGVRKGLADYLSGQQIFDFYGDGPNQDEPDSKPEGFARLK